MANSNQSSGLRTLDAEIRTLKQKARQLETKIDDNFSYFQEHSGSLFIRSLLPRRTEEGALTGNPLLDTFLRNERLQKILMRLADRLAEKLGDGLNWFVTRVFRKD